MTLPYTPAVIANTEIQSTVTAGPCTAEAARPDPREHAALATATSPATFSSHNSRS